MMSRTLLAVGFACLAPVMAQEAQEPQPGEQPTAPRTQPMPVPKAIAPHRGSNVIHIDGVLQDWPSGPPLLLDDSRQVSGTAMAAYRGPSDLRARVFLMWDEEGLLVAGVVADDWHRPLPEENVGLFEIPPTDSLILSIDPRRDTRAIGPHEARSEDREFWAAEEKGREGKVVAWDRYRGTARYANGAIAFVRRDDEKKLTTYELRIPWHEILPGDMKPSEGMVFDFQAVVSDYDEITDPMPQTRVGWTFGTGVRIDPALWGSVMLVGTLGEDFRDMPDFPDAPRGDTAALQEKPWIDLYDRLRATEPVLVHADSDAPEIALGDRLGILREIDEASAKYPRVDYLEYSQRVHRRMVRECGGIAASGLPYFWDHALADLARRAREDVGESGFRIFRMPAGGWLIRSQAINFAIDPAGFGVERAVGPMLDLAALTFPTEITKRHDQLLVRMVAAKRPLYLHRLIHLPGIDGSKFPLIDIGVPYGLNGVRFRAVGVDEDGMVSPVVGYVIEWPDGTILAHTGMVATAEQIVAAVPEHRQIDLLIVSAKHADPAAVVREVRPRMTVFDDVLQCASAAGSYGRVSLDDVLAMQARMRPVPSVIVGPSEFLDITRRR